MVVLSNGCNCNLVSSSALSTTRCAKHKFVISTPILIPSLRVVELIASAICLIKCRTKQNLRLLAIASTTRAWLGVNVAVCDVGVMALATTNQRA
ncbi:hypothetical protein LguiB_017860 [Lonicera macranthoides]